MEVRRPRRIFRASPLGGTAPGSAFARPGMLLAALAGSAIVAILMVFGLPWERFGHAPAPTDLVAADAPQVAVVDGATLRLADRVVRLHGVLAPARGRVCRDTAGAGYDCGAAASSALAALVRDRRVTCRLGGADASGLAEGTCEAGDADLGRDLVAAGWARATDPALLDAEASARAGRIGIWRGAAYPGF